jgi:thiol-disulfide isomerase/thioredoxin
VNKISALLISLESGPWEKFFNVEASQMGIYESRIPSLALASLVILGINLAAGADEPPKPVTSVAGAAWAQYEELKLAQQKYPTFALPTAKETSNAMNLGWLSANYTARFAAARFIWESFPNDARKWDAAFEVVSLGSFLGDRGILSPEEKQLAERLQALLLSDPTVPADTRGRAAVVDFSQRLKSAAKDGTGRNMALLATQLDELGQQYPKADGLDMLAYDAYRALQHTDPAAAEEWARKTQANPNQSLAGYAKGIVAKIDSARRPMEMKFTAFDGREVDLSKLRGKVVLLDFWGTWCGPCVEELPFIRKLHASYGSQGLEIIGILADGASREKLTSFLEKNEITWPQDYDGKVTDNEFAKKYAVKEFPTIMLLNKEGVVVSNARGEALEKQIRELLGL